MIIKTERFGKQYDPIEEKRRRRNSFIAVIVFLICAIIVVVVITIILEKLMLGYVAKDQKETWVASVASYWGGIIGGTISGVLAFLGVFYTIRYFKESDSQKERAAVQPFLLVKMNKDNRKEVRRGYSLGKVPPEREKRIEIPVTIQNIGNGFANTVVINTGYNLGGFAFNKVIPVGEFAYTFFVADTEKLEEGLSFDIQFIDSKANEYSQVYYLRLNDGDIEIVCGYPQLLKQ